MENALTLTEQIYPKSDSEEEDNEFRDLGYTTVPLLLVSSVIEQLSHENKDIVTDCSATKSTNDITKLGPFLKTKWNQDSPFNDFQTNRYPAGCVAVATAQILEYNKSGNPDSMNFDWDLMETVRNYKTPKSLGSTSAKTEVSRFLEYVGLKKNCNIRYKSENESWGVADGAKRTLVNFGYSGVKKYEGFETADLNRVISQLTLGHPVFVLGLYKLSDAHAWVIDGLYVRDVTDDNSGSVSTQNMFHINWGWAGASDGYYSQGVFNTTMRIERDKTYDKVITEKSHTYTWDYRTVIYESAY